MTEIDLMWCYLFRKCISNVKKMCVCVFIFGDLSHFEEFKRHHLTNQKEKNVPFHSLKCVPSSNTYWKCLTFSFLSPLSIFSFRNEVVVRASFGCVSSCIVFNFSGVIGVVAGSSSLI